MPRLTGSVSKRKMNATMLENQGMQTNNQPPKQTQKEDASKSIYLHFKGPYLGIKRKSQAGFSSP